MIPEAAFLQFLLRLIGGQQQFCDASGLPRFDQFAATLFGQLFQQGAIAADIGQFGGDLFANDEFGLEVGRDFDGGVFDFESGVGFPSVSAGRRALLRSGVSGAGCSRMVMGGVGEPVCSAMTETAAFCICGSSRRSQRTTTSGDSDSSMMTSETDMRSELLPAAALLRAAQRMSCPQNL